MRKLKTVWKYAWRALLLVTCLVATFDSASYRAVKGFGFFRSLTLLHGAWAVMIGVMIRKLLPPRVRRTDSVLWKKFEIATPYDPIALQAFIKRKRHETTLVLLHWGVVACLFAVMKLSGLFDDLMLVCSFAALVFADAFFSTVYCLIAKVTSTRCCTHCRVHNWDMLMFTTPLWFAPSFFSYSLVAVGLAVLIVWEVAFRRRPERFFDRANAALSCANCAKTQCAAKRPVRVRAKTARVRPPYRAANDAEIVTAVEAVAASDTEDDSEDDRTQIEC